MVPLTIGLGLLVAVMHTLWLRTGKPEWLRMTRFWGRIYLINFVLGVATGLVQEFQFGLAWSEYSRFVGDVFGSLLALEALRSEEHTSELQSRQYLVCRLLLEKKKIFAGVLVSI